MATTDSIEAPIQDEETPDVEPAQPEVEPEAEDDGLVEVKLAGEPGTTKTIYVNGYPAGVIECGTTHRVTPEAAERMVQCGLL